MDCRTCKDTRRDLSHESDMARMCMIIHRLIVGWIITVFLLAGSWAWFFHYEAQFESETTTIEADQQAEGSNYVVGGDYNG